MDLNHRTGVLPVAALAERWIKPLSHTLISKTVKKNFADFLLKICCNCLFITRLGFEPRIRGFRDRCVKPLHYRAERHITILVILGHMPDPVGFSRFRKHFPNLLV